ncbi:ATPase [Candidatus Woesebacteria bacterium RIFCSPHIGHO2_02_FULL_38_9]|uniref:ATPase n=1 Tax=Candidatus Woesebacteria bacterium RIFCSPHIGHO2_01_FULL_39_28 TaxID=1802496 RepID=A0A1F7YGN7_9BACT|nr:MAG: ATPase [Candidatus Woesebacteria bacterium RIFCSPHIGHO2_01_FULL_39_28]OGM35054.1 MAG: ATPase [Candidatus Woesebacteria bacterium RIFCSPHIGHO2_02_FULL_38_9]OGM56901.1 MAG: ATPase [Candidatus Woesebacteria bacterium RIFCSPLOWO2_01_FULL_38_20]
MFYKRKIYAELLSHTQTPLVTVLTGMRRTGKTTLIQQLLLDIPNKNSLYMDLQRRDNREIFDEKNYEAIRESFIARGLQIDEPMVIALDEIQLAPDSPSAIKYLSDHHKIKFIVTGTSSYYLKNLFSESLSGRKKLFELHPLDFGEFLTFKEISFSQTDWEKGEFNNLEYNRLGSYYEEYIRFGGFPQVVLAQSEVEKRDLLSDIMSSYVNTDVRSLADFSDERNLYSLAKLLAGRVGNRVEYTNLSQLVGLSRPTVTNYISFFEKTYLIYVVPVYTKSIDREIVKSRKLYFCDTGLANTLAELSSGAQFENALFNQLARIGHLQYFALKTGHEIDFILNDNLAIEAKETPLEGDLTHLIHMATNAQISRLRLVGRYKSPKFANYAWAGSIL